MALSVLPTSGLPRDPAWDEAIVPALRKRLEHESQALSRRMSAASIGSAQDDHVFDTFASNAAYHSRDRTATPTLQNPKPSSIPRPSLSHSRTTESPPNGSGASPQPESMKRTRTFSQPFPFDSSLANGALNSPSGMASRSTSPMSITVKSTRIPVSRTRTGSTSSHKQPSLNGVLAHGRSDSRNGSYRGNGHAFQSPPEPMPDLYSLNEGQFSTVSSRSTMKTPRLNGPELSNEPAPFPTSASQVGYDQDFAPARMSSDSEERPFEHWYRGDVSRNGGVGELRIARKQEMLDIANYGHALRHESSRNAVGTSSRSRSNSRGHESPYARGNHRPRSGSLGVPGRASIYIDQDAMPDASMVFDEQPLTDLDSDEEAYNQEDEEYIEEDTTARFDEQSQRGISQLPADRSDTPTTLVDVSKSSIFKSRIPPPSSRQTSESPGMKKSTSNGTNGSPLPSKGTSKSISQASSPAATPKASPAGAKSTATKRRAKSPAAASTAGKKARTKPPAKPTKSRENEDRRSIAQYPSPEGDDIVHAIPTWTQPISGSGNWDDVVLPVVARKKGLEGQYQQVDGSPRPKPTNNVVEPAPGTFGYDHTKYRPPRVDRNPEEIPMDEFGQRKEGFNTVPEEPFQNGEKLSPPLSPLPPRGRSPLRAESPAPFSHYTTAEPVPQIRVTRPSDEAQTVEIMEEEGAESGCCKCIIM